MNNKMHGTGTYNWPNGKNYIGEFKENKMNGLGRFLYADGNIYEGEWKDGLQHGQGKLTNTKGRIREGRWDKGKYQKEPSGISKGNTLTSLKTITNMSISAAEVHSPKRPFPRNNKHKMSTQQTDTLRSELVNKISK